jgi:hypothetical protein
VSDDGPTIVGVGLAAGHDGRAEAVLEVRYANGAQRRLAVTEEALAGALDAAGLDRLDDLLGRSWTVLLAGTRQVPPGPGAR